MGDLLGPKGIRIAQVHCWTPLPTTKKGFRTLAQRFKFRDKPPIAMFVNAGSRPQLLDMSSEKFSGKKFAKQVLYATAAKASLVQISSVDEEPERERRREHVGQRPLEDEDPPGEEPVPDESGEEKDADVVDLDT